MQGPLSCGHHHQSQLHLETEKHTKKNSYHTLHCIFKKLGKLLMLFHFLSSLFLYCFLTDSQFSKIYFLDACRDTMFDKALNIHIQVATYSSLLTISSHVQEQLLSLIISKETQISQWIQCRLDDTQHCRCISAVKDMFCYNFCIYWTNLSVLFLVRQAALSIQQKAAGVLQQVLQRFHNGIC